MCYTSVFHLYALHAFKVCTIYFQCSCITDLTGHASIVHQPLLTYDQLRAEFARLIHKICCILDDSSDQKNNLKNCKRLCCLLKVSDSTNALLFSAEKRAEIRKSQNFDEFFDIVNQHLSWNEYFILTEIIDECDSDEAEQEFNQYKRKMAISNALEMISSTECNPPPGFEKFYSIIDKPYTKLTVEKYEEIKTFIFQNLDVHRHVTNKYIRVLYDSLHLEWHVTMQAVPYMIEMAHKHKALFAKNHFVFMQIGKEVIITRIKVSLQFWPVAIVTYHTYIHKIYYSIRM